MLLRNDNVKHSRCGKKKKKVVGICLRGIRNLHGCLEVAFTCRYSLARVLYMTDYVIIARTRYTWRSGVQFKGKLLVLLFNKISTRNL